MKKRLSVTVALAFIGLSANAQNSWSPKANFGATAGRYGAVGFSICNKGYVGTGSDASGPYKDFWEYDPGANTWTQKADFGGVARSSAVGFCIDSLGYVGTGAGQFSTALNDFWEYSPTSNQWTQKANFAGGNRYHAAGFSVGHYGYMGTGYFGGDYKDFYKYNPSNDSWSSVANFGGTARDGAVGFSIGVNGYVGTGYDGQDRADFWEYNTALNQWTQKDSFPGMGKWKDAGFSIGNMGYVGTGNPSSSTSQDFWEYNSANNTWTQKTNYLSSVYGAVGFSICYKGYIGMGFDGASTYYQNFAEYTPSISPIANFTPSQVSFCVGTCINFTDSSTNLPTSWTWTFSGGTPASDTIQNPANVCFNTAGTYSVSLTTSPNGNCCPLTVTKTISVNPFPPVPTITHNGNVLMSSSASGNQWYLNGTSISGATNQVWTASASGLYTVVVTNTYGCSSTSTAFGFTVGIEDINSNPVIVVYPNPLTSSSLLQLTTQLTDAEVVIYDMVGKELIRKKFTGDKIELEKGILQSGVYFVSIRDSERQYVQKLIIQ